MKYQNTLDSFRPIPFYFLNTVNPQDYTAEAVLEAMDLLKQQGFGGIVLFNKPPTGFDAQSYLSEEWFTITERFIHAARKLNLQLWINDGFNYPPGDAAGRIEAVDPTLKQQRLKPNAEGKLEVVEVPWGFPAFEEPDSSAYFHRFVYEEYYKRFSSYFGDGITGFFSDADNRRINAPILKACPDRYYPWSRNFAKLFELRYGYKIETKLKELFTVSDSPVQKDYWLLCGELYQSWFASNYAWCKEHNILYTFHSSDTGPLNYDVCRRSSAFSEGDPLALLKHADYPGTDHEILVLDGGTHYDSRYYSPKVTLAGDMEYMKHPQMNNTLWDLRAKYAGSAAVLYQRKRTMCEMFAATNWGATYNDLQRIAAWQIIQGINFIVPHAVHHRFQGIIKYFAPPEFSHTTLAHGIREFNDRLAYWCQAAAAGEYLAEYAVIDPTSKVWTNCDTTAFFKFCDQLNRRAEGYVIVPENYNGNIPNVIDPLKNIPELPPSAVSFTGGNLAYMRRKLDNTEYLLAANVWNPETVSGTLSFLGKQYEIELEPGEIAIIGGPFESYRTKIKRQEKKFFTDKYPVNWKEDNVIPFEQQLHFSASKGMKLTLCIPQSYSGQVVVNGTKCILETQSHIYDDTYYCYSFDAQEKNLIELENPVAFAVPALLQGDFDVKIETNGDYHEIVYRTYLLDMYKPKEYDIMLSPRRKELVLDKGWEKQGQVFYSGEAEIYLGIEQIKAGDILELPDFQNTAELLVDGKSIGKLSLAPYIFELPEGTHELTIRCWNTMANRLERYAHPAGLTKWPVIKN